MTTILASAADEMQEHLPTLVPKLYRYCYDPDTNVQQAMKAIWKLVTDKRKGVVSVYTRQQQQQFLNC
jgi:proteasome component ECM29